MSKAPRRSSQSNPETDSWLGCTHSYEQIISISINNIVQNNKTYMLW